MTQETTRRPNAATMSISERSQAIGRAQRALKALGEHPRSSKKELGHAREHLNACYSHGSGDHVWDAVSKVETMAERRYGWPGTFPLGVPYAGSLNLSHTRPCSRPADDQIESELIMSKTAYWAA